MKFFRIKYTDDYNKNKDIILSQKGLSSVNKNYPDETNPNKPFSVSFFISDGDSFGIKFSNKIDADDYFNYVMEKLRALEFKDIPW